VARTADDEPAPGAGYGTDARSASPPDLTPLGLVVGDRVRWRDRSRARWREGRVVGRERDGSVGVRDERGASRALHPERLEVASRGPRGGATWEPVPERAARTEQLGLWAPDGPVDPRQARR
jgi:hypothetical protein